MEYLNECPSSLSEIEKASNRLGCGKDKYGNNQYLCLPNEKKDSLNEFCYNGVMGLQEKGKRLRYIHTRKINEIVCLTSGKIRFLAAKTFIFLLIIFLSNIACNA